MGAPRSPDDRRAAVARGAAAEDHVATLLSSQGWNVVARNWRGSGGELDLVVARGGALRIVEVKARAPGDLYGPAAAMGPAKRRRLVRAAEAFLARWTGTLDEVAFMVAFVEGDAVTLIDDAFDA